LVALPLACGAVSADLTGRQSEAAQQQAALRDRIDALQKEIDAREAAHKEAADALKRSEAAISRINRRIFELSDSRLKAQTSLTSLEHEIAIQEASMGEQRNELARQLRMQYTSGLSPWVTLLSGEDPQQVGRNLGYLDYVSQARVRMVDTLRHEIDRLASLQASAGQRRVEIEKLWTEAAEQKAALLVQQKKHATLLAQLEGQIAAQRAEASKLGRDDQRLTRLINDLGVAIAKQAEKARQAEIARQAEAARQKAAAQVQAAAGHTQSVVDPDLAGLKPLELSPSRKAAPRATPTAPRPDRGAPTVATVEPSSRMAKPLNPPSPISNSSGLRQGLPSPVRGAVQGRFGMDRPDGGVWRGIVLRAPEGTPVQVVASGTVVYAHWLRGFGNLIIVDHGQEYLTVYAYNQSLVKGVGDRVVAGDTIAKVGATGGQVESGLYFEIRHRGAPVDPTQWLAP
jgi:septal ring factor EnvC (AmiA/AmiB activator)